MLALISSNQNLAQINNDLSGFQTLTTLENANKLLNIPWQENLLLNIQPLGLLFLEHTSACRKITF